MAIRTPIVHIIVSAFFFKFSSSESETDLVFVHGTFV